MANDKEVKDIGNFYRTFNALQQKWHRLSFWTDARDVELKREGFDTTEKVSDILKGIRGIDTEEDFHSDPDKYGIALDSVTFKNFISECKGFRFISLEDYNKHQLTDNDEGLLYFVFENKE